MIYDQNYIPTLCWSCAKAVGGCAWSKSFKPIPGWNAIPSSINYYSAADKKVMQDPTYLVMECPEYEHD